MSHTASTVDKLLIRPTHGDQTGAGNNERTHHSEGIQKGAGSQTSHARCHQHQACRSTQPNRRTQASQLAKVSRVLPDVVAADHRGHHERRTTRGLHWAVSSCWRARATPSSSLQGITSSAVADFLFDASSPQLNGALTEDRASEWIRRFA